MRESGAKALVNCMLTSTSPERVHDTIPTLLRIFGHSSINLAILMSQSVCIYALLTVIGSWSVCRIGCGSGIFTRALLSHPDWETSLGALRAIDPNEGMREIFASTIKDSRVTLTDGTFDNTGVDDGWADAILIVTVRLITLYIPSLDPH